MVQYLKSNLHGEGGLGVTRVCVHKLFIKFFMSHHIVVIGYFSQGSNYCWYLSQGTVVYDKLYGTLTNNSLVKGIKQASPFAQSSCLEGFHSVLNHFALKMIFYSYIGMYCRYKKIWS